MILWVDAPHFFAGSVWERKDGWQCVDAAPIIRWMVGKSPNYVRAYLDRKGYKFGWIK